MPRSEQQLVLEKHYKAFISYSHADNREQGRKWADWLHHSLETYHVPAELVGRRNTRGQEIPAQIYPVFQDEKELSASADLGAALGQALDHAEFLIYLASPRSARSIYVQDEIRHFKRSGKGAQIIALILRGDPAAGEGQAQCFPEVLRFAVDAVGQVQRERPEEALAADVRLPHSSDEGFTSVEALRHHLLAQKRPTAEIKRRTQEYAERLNLAKLKIIATILGVPLGELTQRDQAYQLERIRRKNRAIQRVAVVIAVLGLSAMAAGLYAWQQKNEAQKNLAQTLYTSGLNKIAQNEYGDPAAYIAAAVRGGSANAVAFAESMLATRNEMHLLPNMRAAATAFSPDGRYLAGAVSGGEQHRLQVWDARRQQPLPDVPEIATAPLMRQPLFDEQGRVYVETPQRQLLRWQVGATAAPEVVFDNPERQEIALLAVSADGAWLALRLGGQELAVLSVADGQLHATLPALATQYQHAAFASDAQAAVLYRTDEATGITQGLALRLVEGRIALRQPFTLALKAPELVFAPQGAAVLWHAGTHIARLRLAAVTVSGHSAAHSQESPPVVLSVKDLGQRYQRLLFEADGRHFTATRADGYDVYDSATLMRTQTHALPLDTLGAALLDEVGQASPDLTQALVTQNQQTYLKQWGGDNLLITQFLFGPQTVLVLPDDQGQHLYSLEKGASQLARTEVETGRRQAAAIASPVPITRFRPLQGGRVMVFSDGAEGEQTVRVFEASGQRLGQPVTLAARHVLISGDGSRFAARTGADSLAVWQLGGDGRPLLQWRMPQGQPLPRFVLDDVFEHALLADGAHWQLLQLRTGQVLLSGQGAISAARFSPDGRLLALADAQGQAQVLDVAERKLLFRLPTVAQPMMLFSPDGAILAISEDTRRLRLWNTQRQQPYGQIVPVSEESTLLAFSADGRQLFAQDHISNALTPDIKVIDSASGNLISTPFASGRYNSASLAGGDRRIVTVSALPEGVTAKVWQVPGSQQLPPQQLADDLEAFYGRRYDPETGAIGPLQASATDTVPRFATWYLQDPYTRAISPSAHVSVVQAIERQLPLQGNDAFQMLAATYFYHPLARAGLAQYLARQPGGMPLAQRLAHITRLQLARIGDAALRRKTEDLLQSVRTPQP